jgi:hypothetical protein
MPSQSLRLGVAFKVGQRFKPRSNNPEIKLSTSILKMTGCKDIETIRPNQAWQVFCRDMEIG